MKTNVVTIQLFSEQQDNTGEGPVWSQTGQVLYWIDIGSKRLYRRGLSDPNAQSWDLKGYPGSLAEISLDVVGIALGDGIQLLDLQTGELSELWAGPPRRNATRFNDGKVDPLGRFWVGTMQNNFGPDGEPISIGRWDGALYRFDRTGSVETVEEGIGISNTLAWSPDLRRFYFADSLRGQIYAYDFDAESGSVSNKRLFFENELGIPDGSAIDVDGCLWNARWDGGAVVRVTPSGVLDRVIKLPVPRPTSCIFGGPDMDTLFVTSARNGLKREELEEFPLSGSVFAIGGVGQGSPVPPLSCTPRQKQI
jgi:Gluconolactonase